MDFELTAQVSLSLDRFITWLESYGETSQDHQDFFASRAGRAAKALYYRRPTLGKLTVAPMIFCEAFAPWTRRYYFPRTRLPIADAHYAMGFALLNRATGKRGYLERAIHFLEVLKDTRSPEYERHGWGYPFNWQTQGGILEAGTPLITTIPYCFEAFEYVYAISGNMEWRETMRSVADHALLDYQDCKTGPNSASCSYVPQGGYKVVNASAYRAFLLLSAWREFEDERYRAPAERNLNFVLQCQHDDGSWPYAVDGARNFIDHFHTCFVMKALAKIERMTAHEGCTEALRKGVAYYLGNLFDDDGLPRPFARAPRLTVYRRELYDCAECINLGVLLNGRFLELDNATERTIQHILKKWTQQQGCFRSRKLLFGWDNVPMHRWGQSQMFRALAFYLNEEGKKQHAQIDSERLDSQLSALNP